MRYAFLIYHGSRFKMPYDFNLSVQGKGSLAWDLFKAISSPIAFRFIK